MNVSSDYIEKSKIALGRVIAPLAFWSYKEKSFDSKIPDELLIEAVLVHGNDPLRIRLFNLYTPNEIKNVWKNKLIIQGPRLDFLNQKIAKEYFGIADPKKYVRRVYNKNNLYARFSS